MGLFESAIRTYDQTEQVLMAMIRLSTSIRTKGQKSMYQNESGMALRVVTFGLLVDLSHERT